jgi:translation initiation factor 5A
MVFKVIDAIELRDGGFILIDGEAYAVKNIEVSKTGKHGHAKVRFDALSVVDGKKKCIVVPGHERFEVPLIEKKKGQVLSIAGEKASLMDMESFENFELNIPEELKAEVKDGLNVEYWDIEGKKLIKRVM